MREFKIKTTISLPQETIFKLKLKSRGIGRPQEIAFSCLQKYLRKHKSLNLSNAANCTYNREQPCSGKIKFCLSTREHQTLKAIRYTQNISVSFLAYKAINLYLEGIVKSYQAAYTVDHMRNLIRINKIKNHNKEFFKHIHRKISFSGNSLFVLRLIIPIPKKFRRDEPRNTPFSWEKFRI